MNEKQPIPLWRWILWWLLLFFGIVAFYILMTPVWLAVRAAAWFPGPAPHDDRSRER